MFPEPLEEGYDTYVDLGVKILQSLNCLHFD